MTWYRMSGSSKGELHGASVLVTVDGEITSGDTVTLSATGYSQTKTLSDVKTALFTDILESGTYTATYKTYSKTVEVSAQDVLDKTTKNVTVATSTTITLTIEGAKEDNIKIYDSANTQVGSCVFASGQTTGTVELEIPATGGTYKFESTVAKDTETGTSNYSKNVTLTNNTSEVKVMPDNCLYWYGNEVKQFTTSNYQYKASDNNGVINRSTNLMTFVSPGTIDARDIMGTADLLDLTGSTKVAIYSNVTNRASWTYLTDSKFVTSGYELGTMPVGKSITKLSHSKTSEYFSIVAISQTIDFYAIWLE